MSVFLSPVGGAGAQFFDNSGNPLTGGKLYTYAAGTTTPQATYTSSAGSVFHSNPIILDAAGRVPGSSEIWLTDSAIYKFVLKDSNDVLLATWDQITGVNSNFVNYTTETEVQTATAGQTVFTLTTMQYQPATGSLTVFIDGVNQYEGTSYLETDSTTVTFLAGVHVGALVKFTTAIQTTGNATDASVVTYDPPFAGSVATTVQDKLAQYVSVKDFGADPTGVADSTAAIQAAIDSEANVFFPPGKYRTTATLTVATYGQVLKGSGYHGRGTGSFNPVVDDTAKAQIIKDGNFDAVVLQAPGSGVDSLEINGAPGNGGDGIYLLGLTSFIQNTNCFAHGGDGIRIGQKAATPGSYNTNTWRLTNVLCNYNGGNGLLVFDEVGPPWDVNAGVATGLVTSFNGAAGVRLESLTTGGALCIDNQFFGLISDFNATYGLHIVGNSVGNTFWFPYFEVNTIKAVLMDSVTSKNVIFGVRAGVVDDYSSGFPTDDYEDNGTANIIFGRDADISGYRFRGGLIGFTGVAFRQPTQPSGQKWQIGQDPSGASNDLVCVAYDNAGSTLFFEGQHSVGGGQVWTKFAAHATGFGSLGNPSYTFNGDFDTGMRRSAANELALDAGGTTGLKVKASGVLNASGLPTSSAGLASGDLWVDTDAGNVIKRV